ncbi:hypothetical protein BKA56DRAFT_612789 [Ilyonectria sp. MPI-CAGE-AT-0026]|nr:hypothetical protein BKA56DRAFT_612789 [Ilyonectria sp. MPI-CAGE-AT-0026]
MTQFCEAQRNVASGLAGHAIGAARTAILGTLETNKSRVETIQRPTSERPGSQGSIDQKQVTTTVCLTYTAHEGVPESRQKEKKATSRDRRVRQLAFLPSWIGRVPWMSRRGVMFKPVQGRDCAIASPRQSKTDWWRVRAQEENRGWELFILLAEWRARRVSAWHPTMPDSAQRERLRLGVAW